MSAASVFTKIVCGVDGSPAGLEAVKQAQRLAPAGAELTLVSVSESHLAVHTGAAAEEWAQRRNDEAPCSVLVARGGDWPWPRSIVVGLDGSDGSFAAAVVAHDVAARLGSAVRLLVARGGSAAHHAPRSLLVVRGL